MQTKPEYTVGQVTFYIFFTSRVHLRATKQTTEQNQLQVQDET